MKKLTCCAFSAASVAASALFAGTAEAAALTRIDVTAAVRAAEDLNPAQSVECRARERGRLP